MTLNIKQFNELLLSLTGQPIDTSSLTEGQRKDIDECIESFRQNIFGSKGFGYPNDTPISDRSFEDRILNISKKITGNTATKIPSRKLILTHDIDYIDITPQYYIKNLLGRRKLGITDRSEFLDSLEEILDFDNSLGATPICFIPTSGEIKGRTIKSWIVDPSYRLNSKAGNRLKSILKKHSVQIGIHGSVESMTKGYFEKEISILKNWWGEPITKSRQHWLHMPSNNFFNSLANAGINEDFTCGWNGQLGFRGGIMRNFKYNTNDTIISEYPMTLMDGVIFDELNLSEDQALDLCKSIVDRVYENGGDVVLNWHGRVFSSRYGWQGLYKNIINYSAEKGFRF